MLTGLLEWILIIAAIIIIFNANNLYSWKETARKKIDVLKKAAVEKKAELENKINTSKNKKDKE